MTLYPAIDLKDGACVRLVQGDMDRATVFSDDPPGQARAFAAMGFRWLHVVDLNGAFAGRAINSEAVSGILAAGGLKVQLGGGIRDLTAIERWLEAGVTRVILGTVAQRDPALVREACRLFPDQIAVGIDARGGMVAVDGWVEVTETSARDLALAFEDAGAVAIIYTDIERDGALSGMNVEATVALAQAVTTPVIASGGITSLADLEVLKTVAASGIEGVISGRALYDGRLPPRDALTLLAS
ncbi:MAG TPA: 1-(5-phosphoribosyl)-5-[(5-phosphoribosylamino)methylideneamino]imidazole-4-carboxamide isomerase [Alphaproteobacteria bacterium]|nr:1-(5-phosphoribosyl)-5-[(5-phosphoribosylamino)methylideneamino]imidazole-4-carboxamide isomerase [Alphaproteobacteria bacterium]